MKKYFPVYVRVPVIFFTFFGAIEYFIDSGDRPAFIKYPVITFILLLFILLQIAFELIYEATNNILNGLLTEEQRKQKNIDENRSFTETDFYKNWMQRLTKTESIENEDQLLLAHDYDGIKELDNNLPPWWVYLFYGCIVFAAIYLIRFEIMGGDNQETELIKEMAQAKIDVAQYLKNAPDMMDEKTVTLLTKPEELAEGKTIFTTNCIACHRADGGGNIGPNLTDDHWILGGGIKNLFHTITNGGRDGKGMIAWSKNGLKPKEIQKVTSYVLSLQGSNPKDGKVAEGEVWVDPSIATNPIVKVDSLQVKK